MCWVLNVRYVIVAFIKIKGKERCIKIVHECGNMTGPRPRKDFPPTFRLNNTMETYVSDHWRLKIIPERSNNTEGEMCFEKFKGNLGVPRRLLIRKM